eukprot:1724474-Rhodomonas_salina.7
MLVPGPRALFSDRLRKPHSFNRRLEQHRPRHTFNRLELQRPVRGQIQRRQENVGWRRVGLRREAELDGVASCAVVICLPGMLACKVRLDRAAHEVRQRQAARNPHANRRPCGGIHIQTQCPRSLQHTVGKGGRHAEQDPRRQRPER